jgi:hypothetical protein
MSDPSGGARIDGARDHESTPASPALAPKNSPNFRSRWPAMRVEERGGRHDRDGGPRDRRAHRSAVGTRGGPRDGIPPVSHPSGPGPGTTVLTTRQQPVTSVADRSGNVATTAASSCDGGWSSRASFLAAWMGASIISGFRGARTSDAQRPAPYRPKGPRRRSARAAAGATSQGSRVRGDCVSFVATGGRNPPGAGQHKSRFVP